jgi:hypothetical protein
MILQNMMRPFGHGKHLITIVHAESPRKGPDDPGDLHGPKPLHDVLKVDVQVNEDGVLAKLGSKEENVKEFYLIYIFYL